MQQPSTDFRTASTQARDAFKALVDSMASMYAAERPDLNQLPEVLEKWVALIKALIQMLKTAYATWIQGVVDETDADKAFDDVVAKLMVTSNYGEWDKA